MRATKQFNNVDTQSKITINTDELQAMLWPVFCHTDWRGC